MPQRKSVFVAVPRSGYEVMREFSLAARGFAQFHLAISLSFVSASLRTSKWTQNRLNQQSPRLTGVAGRDEQRQQENRKR